MPEWIAEPVQVEIFHFAPVDGLSHAQGSHGSYQAQQIRSSQPFIWSRRYQPFGNWSMPPCLAIGPTYKYPMRGDNVEADFDSAMPPKKGSMDNGVKFAGAKVARDCVIGELHHYSVVKDTPSTCDGKANDLGDLTAGSTNYLPMCMDNDKKMVAVHYREYVHALSMISSLL